MSLRSGLGSLRRELHINRPQKVSPDARYLYASVWPCPQDVGLGCQQAQKSSSLHMERTPPEGRGARCWADAALSDRVPWGRRMSNADIIEQLAREAEYTDEYKAFARMSEAEQDAFVMRPVQDVDPDTLNVSDERVFVEAFGTGIFGLIDNLERMKVQFRERVELCESPMERRLYAALCGIAYATKSQISIVRPQVNFGRFRVDFTIECRRLVVVECDGHEHHERTKEQARRDKARDRFFASKGIPVVRFTGSEVWANPVRCAEQAFIVAARA